ncbi:Protein of unknown function [Pyronema omphalodes CBS 100304]|uniref:Uncharacterized protein n=1 Tax=Pyronema omphalodes (strain CBS 100304) TaxID=1076935 RepID=U4KVC7_PYROM|nr:Protein of unknown function [Pyronema omphalodes CBS 100304]
MQQDILEIIVVTLETGADGSSSRQRSKRESILLPTKPDVHDSTSDKTPQLQESESNETETETLAEGPEGSEGSEAKAATYEPSDEASAELNGESTNTRNTPLSTADSTSVITVTTDFITVVPANLQ